MKLCIVVILGLILSTSSAALLSVNAAGYSGRPYLGSPVSLPGVVEAANYDLGGQGVAYNVLSSVNQGGAYRTTEAVSLEQTGDSTTSASGDAYDMGWINPTEWENYTVTSVGGPFTASIRVAANGSGGTFHLECPTGTKITGELTIPNTGGWQTYTTLTAPVTLPAGNQVLRVVWDTAPSGFVGNFHWIQISSSSNVGSVNAGGYSGRPYLGSPVSLPGVVEAANYDLGGQGVAYNVLSSVNQGGAYRTSEAVSLEQTGDSTTPASGDAFDMGWINPTEWENYTVTSAGGPFTASIRVAANGSGGTFHLECPTGTKITGELTIPNTGGWQTYTTLTAPVTLPAGNQVLRIVWDTAPSGFVGNFHWIQITSSSNVGSVNAGGYSGRPYLGSPVSLPGVVEAANYDLGGQGVAYNVLSSVNQGGAYRTSEAVSLEQTGDSTTPASGDAYDMGWINPTEWENYTVTSVGGPFTASIRVAANGSGGTFHLECPTGTKITGELTIPNTGGWQTYTTLTAPVTLPAGNQVLRIVWDTAPSGFVGNFHWIQISSSSNVGSVNAGGYSGRPYLGSPVSLPGVVEAANYDLGGQGVAYNVLSSVNQGGAYRTSEAVSLEQTGDSTTSASGDAYDMGWINPTEWENYTVTSVGGPFTASIRVAADGSGGTFHLECPTGTKITGELTIPDTGGWQTYTTLTAPVRLPAGNQVLRIVWDTAPSGFVGNFHWIQISSSSNVGQAPANAGGYSGRPYLGSPVSLPGVVEAANYDLGGQGVAYNVLSSVNQGGAYRTSEAVSLEQTGDSTTSASGDAYDMGWINPTEWENYTVTSAGGPFTASIRVAADGSGGTFHLECPTGTKITGELTIPNTGGWQTYTTLTAPVTLPAGNQVLRIVWDTAPSGFVGNFHWIQITSSSGGTDTAWVVSPATDSISGPYPMTIQYHAVGNMTGRDVTGSVTWTSSNPPLVSIGAGGLALIVDPGSAGITNVTITATK